MWGIRYDDTEQKLCASWEKIQRISSACDTQRYVDTAGIICGRHNRFKAYKPRCAFGSQSRRTRYTFLSGFVLPFRHRRIDKHFKGAGGKRQPKSERAFYSCRDRCGDRIGHCNGGRDGVQGRYRIACVQRAKADEDGQRLCFIQHLRKRVHNNHTYVCFSDAGGRFAKILLCDTDSIKRSKPCDGYSLYRCVRHGDKGGGACNGDRLCSRLADGAVLSVHL